MAGFLEGAVGGSSGLGLNAFLWQRKVILFILGAFHRAKTDAPLDIIVIM